MKQHRKALSIIVASMMAVLVAWLGATHTIAQEVPAQSQALSVPSAPPERAASLLERAGQLAQQSQNALIAATGAANAVEPDAEPVAEPAADTVAEIQAEGDVITHWPLQDAPIRLVLRQLSMWSQKNIVASKNVKGTVTTDLFNVTFREALNALLHVNGLACTEEGSFIYVYTAEELAAIEAANRKIATRVFRLRYVKTEDVVKLVTPLLSPTGRLSATPATAAGIKTSKVETGGMDYATEDMLVVSDYEENLARIEEVLREADVQPLQVLIEATVMVAGLDEDNRLGIDWAAVASTNLGGATFQTAVRGNVSGGLSFTWQGSDFQLFLDALEHVTDVNVLANPKLLVVNKQRGEIIVGDEIGYLDSTTRDDSGATTQSVAFLETGTRLVVRPFVGSGGNIRLEIHPELSDGGLDSLGLPQKQTTECTSNVIVRDGHTVVISGLFRERTSNGRTQVPLFGNIPIAGALFRSTADEIKREEVIILITPRILRQASDEATSVALQDNAERFRVGMRQNLSWFGRSRLAVCHLNWAKDHLAAGRLDRALWDVNLTLSLSPANLEAIQLKEYLTGQAIWAKEARKSNSRWIIQSMIMNELGLNVNLLAPSQRPADANDLPAEAKEAMGIGRTYDAPILPAAPAADGADEVDDRDGDDDDEQTSQADAAADEPFEIACDMVLSEPVVTADAQ